MRAMPEWRGRRTAVTERVSWGEFEYRLADLRLSLAARRFSLALDDMVRKYRPDQPRAPKGTSEGGRWVFDAGSLRRGRPAKVSPRRLLAWMPTGFTKHGINQAINRGVSASDISDALNNPIRVTAGSSPYSWKYRGARAEVVLNSFGRVITLWPR